MGEFFDVLFEQDRQNYNEETLPLDEIIFEAIQTAQLEMHVCLPCFVTAVDASTGYVSVQPTLQTRYKIDDSATDMTIIQTVPVQVPSGQDWWIKAPVAIGDVGILLFAERSIDNWAVTNGQEFVDPQDSRMFDLSDAIFVPGLRTIKNPIPSIGTTDLVVHNGDSEILWKKNGKLKIKNNATSLGVIVDSLLMALNTTATALIANPVLEPAAFAAGTALAAALIPIQVEVDSLLE